jgi:hypothetical protein
VFTKLNLEGDLSTMCGNWGVLKISVDLSGVINKLLLTTIVRFWDNLFVLRRDG